MPPKRAPEEDPKQKLLAPKQPAVATQQDKPKFKTPGVYNNFTPVDDNETDPARLAQGYRYKQQRHTEMKCPLDLDQDFGHITELFKAATSGILYWRCKTCVPDKGFGNKLIGKDSDLEPDGKPRISVDRTLEEQQSAFNSCQVFDLPSLAERIKSIDAHLEQLVLLFSEYVAEQRKANMPDWPALREQSVQRFRQPGDRPEEFKLERIHTIAKRVQADKQPQDHVSADRALASAVSGVSSGVPMGTVEDIDEV